MPESIETEVLFVKEQGTNWCSLLKKRVPVLLMKVECDENASEMERRSVKEKGANWSPFL